MNWYLQELTTESSAETDFFWWRMRFAVKIVENIGISIGNVHAVQKATFSQ